MRTLLILGWALLNTSQEPAPLRELVERLGAEAPSDRTDAERRLQAAGDAAAGALREGARSADPEIASRSRRLLRILELRAGLPASLRRAIPRVEERLADGPDAWSKLFLELGERFLKTWPAAPSGGLGKADLDALVSEAILGAPTPEIRVKVMETSAGLKLRSALPALRSQFRHPDRSIQSASLHARARLDDREALSDLVDAAGDPTYGSRSTAAFLLVQGREPEAVRAIVSWIEKPDDETIPYAVPAAGELGIREAVPGLLGLLRKPHTGAHRDVSSQAAFSLVLLGGPEVVAALKELLTHESAEIRVVVLRALTGLGAADALPAMETLLRDRESAVRGQAVESVSALGGGAWLPKVLTCLKDPSAGVRAECADAIRRFGVRESVEPLLALLKDPEHRVRYAASGAVQVLRPEGAVEALLPLLGEPGMHLAWTISQLGVQGCLPKIRVMLDDPRPGVREDAAFLLGMAGDHVAVPRLRELLKDADAEVRGSALRALLRLKVDGALDLAAGFLEDPVLRIRTIHAIVEAGPAARPLFVKLLEKPDPELLDRPILWSMTKALKKEAIPLLLPFLDHPDSNVQTSALWNLVVELDAAATVPEIARRWREAGKGSWGWLAQYSVYAGVMEPLPALFTDSKRSDAVDRARVIENLVLANARSCIPALRECLREDVPEVVGAAAEALGRFGDAASAPAMRGLLNHGHVVTRHAAARGLCHLGDPDGARVLVEESASGSFVLNRFRRPELWTRLARTPLPEDRAESFRELLRKLSNRIGLPVETLPHNWNHPDYLGHRDMWGLRIPNASVLDALLYHAGGAFVLESDRIRALDSQSGERFWREWWAAEGRK